MAPITNCNENTDPLKLVREGTSREHRLSPALDPASAPVNERTPAHAMVFAQAYAAFLKFYDGNNVPVDNWQRFFSEDVSVQLALASIQDVDYYKANIKSYFDYLNNLDNETNAAELKNHLGYLFSCLGSLARRLDALKEALPTEISLQGALQNLVQTQLAAAFQKLIAYYKADLALAPADRLIGTVQPGIVILGHKTMTLSQVLAEGLSTDWITDGSPDWDAYVGNISPDDSVYGSGAGVFDKINHIATHNLFSSIFDQFLKVYARTVQDAQAALQSTFTDWDRHEPHYALFLACLRLFEYARAEANTLTKRHLDFYYREILRLKEKPAQAGHAHLLIELAKNADPHVIPAGELFRAGKDDLGADAFFANDRDLVANQARVGALKTVYRHKNTSPNDSLPNQHDRLFASPVTNSDDGLGAELTTVDQSWHPFFNKIYEDGNLTEIRMPKAEIGFAVASHYLWMAEGTRTVRLTFTASGATPGFPAEAKEEVLCLLTAEKGWIEKTADTFKRQGGALTLEFKLSGDDPPVTPYLAKTHGYTFDTDLPLLLVKLRHGPNDLFIYASLQDLSISSIDLEVDVDNLRTLAISNDFGPVDASKPFQPYGASPIQGNALVVGSKEVFQKQLTATSLNINWLEKPSPYPGSATVNVNIRTLQKGKWEGTGLAAMGRTENSYGFSNKLNSTVVDAPNLTEPAFYNTGSTHGFLRLELTAGYGQAAHQTALVNFLKGTSGSTNPGNPPAGPTIGSLSMDYKAKQTITLNSAGETQFNARKARFYHLAPFGQAEQHPYLSPGNSGKVFLLPQFEFERDSEKKESEAELYIGVTGLKPPQNLALLFQIVDGTADPLSEKPQPHLHWSYLRANEWIPFAQNEVEDQTGGLLQSGIITFAVPREAADGNSLLPGGMHWFRAAVSTESDAVCRLQMVAAQALQATFSNRNNDPAFPAKVLSAGTINKLRQPQAAVKKVTQPFATFGGRGAETPGDFYTRISERLRHKDRAVALWDYERLVLEAFPQIYKVKCLNHTHYEPNEAGTGIYRELAPGHVTVVTIPNQQFQNLRDPLRPYTSLGLLEEIAGFLGKRLSCFAKLHVKNPQFEEVRTQFKVRLYDGFDETFYRNKLQEAITRFLSPWAFSNAENPSFGGKIYKAALINFVEEQPYVDYVTDFQLFHDVNEEKGSENKSEVEGSKAVSILVSVPAKEHEIEVINPAVEEAPREKCNCEA
jgi:tetratricopeptide (TPR) repeat protein